LFLQSFGYAKDPVHTLRAVRAMLNQDGFILLTRTQPIRYALERAEQNGTTLGEECFSKGTYTYRTSWNEHIALTKRWPRTEATLARGSKRARSLRLSNDERAHLFHLAGHQPSPADAACPLKLPQTCHLVRPLCRLDSPSISLSPLTSREGGAT